MKFISKFNPAQSALFSQRREGLEFGSSSRQDGEHRRAVPSVPNLGYGASPEFSSLEADVEGAFTATTRFADTTVGQSICSPWSSSSDLGCFHQSGCVQRMESKDYNDGDFAGVRTNAVLCVDSLCCDGSGKLLNFSQFFGSIQETTKMLSPA